MLCDLHSLLIEPVERRGRTYSRCPVPSHGQGRGDRHRSLETCRGNKGWLVICRAHCSIQEITEAWGIRVADLFYNAVPLHGSGLTLPPKPPSRVALAFRYELFALDLRLRAERLREAGQKLHVRTMTDEELDRALEFIALSYTDTSRAELFENLADTLRARDFIERMDREQQRRSA